MLIPPVAQTMNIMSSRFILMIPKWLLMILLNIYWLKVLLVVHVNRFISILIVIKSTLMTYTVHYPIFWSVAFFLEFVLKNKQNLISWLLQLNTLSRVRVLKCVHMCESHLPCSGAPAGWARHPLYSPACPWWHEGGCSGNQSWPAAENRVKCHCTATGHCRTSLTVHEVTETYFTQTTLAPGSMSVKDLGACHRCF